MMKYEEQLRWKEQKVRSDLQRLGGFQEIPWNLSRAWRILSATGTKPSSPLDTTGRGNWWPVFTPAEPTPSYRQMIAFGQREQSPDFGADPGLDGAVRYCRLPGGHRKGAGAPRADPQRLRHRGDHGLSGNQRETVSPGKRTDREPDADPGHDFHYLQLQYPPGQCDPGRLL